MQEKTSATDTKDSVKIDKPPSAINEYLITDTSFGQITRSTTYDDLKKIFGSNIVDTIEYGAEGLDSFIVTKVYSNTPKEIVISWLNRHKYIAEVYTVMENSPYHTAEGLQVGSTLQKLLEVNGRKINFSGTGWDYGGAITSFNNGKFKESNIFFSLAAGENAEDVVMGDQELNTDMQKVKRNMEKLFIARVAVLFNNHRSQ